ncbi:Tyrosyl-DNA phosphodiesterase 2 (Tyr-DNA phosphodiesterase 2) (5'-tyrosyl-DNA phosphodiesterase) (5'-Tyr-DNA phosphodiesterase) (TRAF and TNF receptor-associated protein) [Durusdinium trenchii]|uniref:Tyrosyl-DNA phosphodiesterase 2 (Tyr-DNA phosphodiesterase 2) (5'-tyrosyl-DNA phosphodiesterase) (5'-Tyr-DNA phosphodiesterase) (TRAF and TNF receptor-associated protein) n=1 Tax=Durusdinium trenchii TaxID=1381693 RepID=A0ABP0QEM4_9DINO
MKFLSVASLEPKVWAALPSQEETLRSVQHVRAQMQQLLPSIGMVAVTLAALASASLRGVPTSSSATVRPSTVENCPANFKDCGPCRCVPEHTCDFCIGGPDVDNNETNVDPDTDIEPRPSSVVGCPETHVDCGNCQCVPSSTCSWCSDDHPHPPVNPPGSGTGNSSVPLCPKNFKDCGSCLCVPEAVCSSCGEHPVQPLPNPLPNVSMRPSEVPGCPETNKDCGQCSCVPESSCNWCPGAAAVATTPGTEPVTTSPVQVTTPEPMPSTTTSSYDGLTSPGIISRPSRVPYCPAAYRDCGIVNSRPSTIIGCPAAYRDCGTCFCVPESSCQWCPGAITRPLLSDLQKVILRPTETRVRQRDGQVLLERRSAEGLLAQEVVGMEEPPQFLEDQAKGLSRLTPKIFEPSSSRWLAQQVDASAAAELNTATQTLRVVSYNVWFSEFRQEIRAKALFAILDDEDADVVCLQEVTPTFLAWLREEHFVQERYSLSDTVGTTLQGAQLAYGVVLLLKRTLHATAMELWRLPTRMGRSLLLAKLPMEELELWVATVHLESDSQDLRREQLRCIVEVLDGASHVILAGDMNFGDFAVEEVELRQAGYHDCTAQSGHTMPRSDFGHRAERLDRIYSKEVTGAATRFVPSKPELLGTEACDLPSPHGTRVRSGLSRGGDATSCGEGAV